MLWCFTVAVAGGLVGLVLGNIRLPFTLVIASSAAAGTGANLLDLGGRRRHRGDRARARRADQLAAVRVDGAPVDRRPRSSAAICSGVLPRSALLGVISAVLLYSSFDLARWTPPAARARRRQRARARHRRRRRRGRAHRAAGRHRRADPRLAAGARPAEDRRRAPGARRGHQPRRRLLGRRLRRRRAPALRPAGLEDRRSRGGRVDARARSIGARLTGRLSEIQLVRAIAGRAPGGGGSPRARRPCRSLGRWPKTSSARRRSCFSAWCRPTRSTPRATSARRRSCSPACCATRASRSTCSAAPRSAPTSSRACAGRATGRRCACSRTSTPSSPIPPSGSATRGRATSSTACSGAVARRT